MTLHITALTTVTNASRHAEFAPVSVPRRGLYRTIFKRALDLLLVLFALPVVLPLILMMAILVAVLTGGQPLYSQLRVGRDGNPFRMWKLRTMVKNADALLEDHLRADPSAREEWDTTQKLKNDPRITSVGRLIRKTSMDELPQLFNVLNGTMSLVGPRPMMVFQKEYYHGHAYFEVRPGITGLWQVSERNNCSFKDRVAYDDRYNNTLSLKTDVSILWRTVAVIMRATGH